MSDAAAVMRELVRRVNGEEKGPTLFPGTVLNVEGEGIWPALDANAAVLFTTAIKEMPDEPAAVRGMLVFLLGVMNFSIGIVELATSFPAAAPEEGVKFEEAVTQHLRDLGDAIVGARARRGGAKFVLSPDTVSEIRGLVASGLAKLFTDVAALARKEADGE